MAWQYTAICLYDFMLMPSFMFWWAHFTNTPYFPWTPLTLQGAGLYHISMGAIVTATSWSKSKEKIASSNDVESNQPA